MEEYEYILTKKDEETHILDTAGQLVVGIIKLSVVSEY